MGMFGLSFTHLIILAVLALVFIGPEQLPEVARTIARLLNEWKRATGDLQSSLTNHLKDDAVLRREQQQTAPPNELPPHGPGPRVDAQVQPLETAPPIEATTSVEKKS